MSYTITDLREDLAASIKGVRDKSMTVEEAKAVSDLGQTMINSAKVEVDMLKALGRRNTSSTGFVPIEQLDTLDRQDRKALEQH